MHRWHFERFLHTQKVIKVVLQLVALTSKLYRNAEFKERLWQLRCLACLHASGTSQRSTWKENTREGACWIERRWQDIGNYYYSFFWMLLCHEAARDANAARDACSEPPWAAQWQPM